MGFDQKFIKKTLKNMIFNDFLAVWGLALGSFWINFGMKIERIRLIDFGLLFGGLTPKRGECEDSVRSTFPLPRLPGAAP